MRPGLHHVLGPVPALDKEVYVSHTPLTDAVFDALIDSGADFTHPVNLMDRHARKMERDRAELIDHLNGLLGLVQLIGHRDDLPAGMRDAMLQNHRFVDALALSGRLAPKEPA